MSGRHIEGTKDAYATYNMDFARESIGHTIEETPDH